MPNTMFPSDDQSVYDMASDEGSANLKLETVPTNGTTEQFEYTSNTLSYQGCFMLISWGLLIIFWTVFIVLNVFGKEDRMANVFPGLRAMRIRATKRIALQLVLLKHVHIDRTDLKPINVVSTSSRREGVTINEEEKGPEQVVENAFRSASSIQKNNQPLDQENRAPYALGHDP